MKVEMSSSKGTKGINGSRVGVTTMFNSCYVPAGENIRVVNESIKKKVFVFHFKIILAS